MPTRAAPPDLVVAIAVPAMHFCLRYRDELFPGRPLLIADVDQRRLEGVKLGARDRVVSMKLDFLGAARTMLQVRPEITTFALVLGTSQLEQFWRLPLWAPTARYISFGSTRASNRCPVSARNGFTNDARLVARTGEISHNSTGSRGPAIVAIGTRSLAVPELTLMELLPCLCRASRRSPVKK